MWESNDATAVDGHDSFTVYSFFMDASKGINVSSDTRWNVSQELCIPMYHKNCHVVIHVSQSYIHFRDFLRRPMQYNAT